MTQGVTWQPTQGQAGACPWLEFPAAKLGLRDGPARTRVWLGSLHGLGFRIKPTVGKLRDIQG